MFAEVLVARIENLAKDRVAAGGVDLGVKINAIPMLVSVGDVGLNVCEKKTEEWARSKKCTLNVPAPCEWITLWRGVSEGKAIDNQWSHMVRTRSVYILVPFIDTKTVLGNAELRGSGLEAPCTR